MDKRKLEVRVAEQVEKIIAETDLQLVDVEYVKEKDWYLRIFLDKVGGIALEDCQFVSRTLDQWLDEADPVPFAYHLEVSSPGLDRPLKKENDFTRNLDKSLEVTFFAPWEGKKVWVGLLKSFDGDKLVVEIENEMIELPRKQIAQARLHLG